MNTPILKHVEEMPLALEQKTGNSYLEKPEKALEQKI